MRDSVVLEGWINCYLYDVFVVSETETAVSTVENQPAAEEPPTLKFTWTIPHFSRINTRKQYSDVFVVGGYKW